ncbi:Afi1p [Sugiyamaella lignohabitans]|uniref:Afi1p n=1 Tax=Sugiyamaella lignohabitans TaxID=796027 RepID=A0A167F761_9ASCO|nr:Afi1p [Sugiyamaella lignohabitans]ANB14896.1 Afi1p [Sugiyamaella lignohabitans]
MDPRNAHMEARHVEYVLTAEFDIDAGPTVSHQYPEVIQSDRHLMAELMLPDQIHARNEDWTVFFLYRRPGSQQLEYNILDEVDKEAAEKFYVLNLVNTKFDSNARRGAIVKSMAIVTPHPFFQVFKPLLLLALDDYFEAPGISHLENLYDILNSVDMSQVPRFTPSERLLLASSEYTSLFIEKFDAQNDDNHDAFGNRNRSSQPRSLAHSFNSRSSITQSEPRSPRSPKSPETLVSTTLDRPFTEVPPPTAIAAGTTNSTDTSSSTATNASIDATTSSRLSNLNISPPSTTADAIAAATAVAPVSTTTLTLASSLSTPLTTPTTAGPPATPSSITSTPVGLTRRTSTTTIQQPSFYIDLRNQGQRLSSSQARTAQRDSHFFDTTVPYKSMNIPIKIPTDFSPESVGDFSLIKLIALLTSMNQPFTTLHPHLTIYGPHTPPLLVLIFALLTQKRILFIGLNALSRDVAEHVLACCSLASGGGILRSYTTHAFPYTDLSKVDDLLASNGYIAGVKNPTFEHHANWWDIIVDLEHGTMKISPDIGTPAPPGNHRSLANGSSGAGLPNYSGPVNAEDLSFVDEVKKMVANHYGETSVRTRCQQYIKRFVRMSTNYEEYKYGATNLWPSFNDPDYLVVPGYGYTWASESQKVSDFALYAPVIEGWRASRSYKYYIDDQRGIWQLPPKYVIDYECHLDRLRLQQLSYEESASVFEALCTHTQDYDDINRLLSATHQNNLFYLCLGMFHRDASIRIMTVRLLQRIEQHTAGKLYFQSIGQFQKLAYKRLVDELNSPANTFVPQDGVPF